MQFIFTTFLVAVTVATLYRSADAFPAGAGGCTGGEAAVGASHLVNGKTGSLADGGLSVSLDGVPLIAGSTVAFPVGTSTGITVTSSAKPFKGFLLRLGETGGVSTDAAFSFNSMDIQKASACFDVGGITHMSKSAKTSVSATLNLPNAAAAMPLDVTIVIVNNETGSEYYYSQYFLTASDQVQPATPAPTQRVTPAPTRRVTPAPTRRVTPAPTRRVTPLPVRVPTKKPVKALRPTWG
jgi:Reeler domain